MSGASTPDSRAPWVVPRAPVRRPTVSIVMPSHPGENRERISMTAEAVASVHAQTFTDYQLLQDDYAEWWPDKINELASLALGEYLCILPSDDKLHPEFLAKCVAAAREHAADMVYTNIQIFGARDVPFDYLGIPFSLEGFKHRVCPWMTMLIKTTLWRELGGHDVHQDFQDTDFGIRLAKRQPAARVVHIPELLVYAREHPEQGGRRMNHSSALLRLQAAHPDVYPSNFIAPAPRSVEEQHAIETKARWEREAKENARHRAARLVAG